jgi:putative DNA-invertase from lambdoid prophage Rac
VGSDAKHRPEREALLKAARRREIDVVIVWRLDHWGRSLADLVTTLQELTQLGIGFISLNEALDLTTPAGRAMAGNAFSLCRIRAGDYSGTGKSRDPQAKAEGRQIERPQTAAKRKRK